MKSLGDSLSFLFAAKLDGELDGGPPNEVGEEILWSFRFGSEYEGNGPIRSAIRRALRPVKHLDWRESVCALIEQGPLL